MLVLLDSNILSRYYEWSAGLSNLELFGVFVLAWIGAMLVGKGIKTLANYK